MSRPSRPIARLCVLALAFFIPIHAQEPLVLNRPLDPHALQVLLEDDQGALWIGTLSGVHPFHASEPRFSPPFLDRTAIPQAGTFRLVTDQSETHLIDKSGAWWHAPWALGAYFLIIATGIFFFDRFMRRRIVGRERQRARLEQAELRALAAEAQTRALKAEEERMRQELDQARALQLSMLPDALPEMDHLDIAAHMQTATEVGGDYYDFYQDEEGGLTLALGDATGHGLNAGTVVTLVKSLFVAHARQGDMRSLFGDIAQTLRHMRLGNRYMGLILGRITNHELALRSAGMPPVYHWRQTSRTLTPLITKSLPLGAMADFPYSEHRIRLETGDTLFFMTDGLPELFNPDQQEFGYDRVERLIQAHAHLAPEAFIQTLLEEARHWRGGSPLSDDLTLLAIQIKNCPEDS